MWDVKNEAESLGVDIGSVKYIILQQYHIPSLETSSIKLRLLENYHDPPNPVAQKWDDPPLCSEGLGPIYIHERGWPGWLGYRDKILSSVPMRNFSPVESGGGQSSVRSGKRMAAKGKKKRTVLAMAVIGGRIEVLQTHWNIGRHSV